MINIGFISTAHIHTRGFLQRIAEREDARVFRVWDDDPERGNRFAAEFDLSYCDDLAGVAATPEIDAFVISAENGRHLPLLEAVLPAGKPVFCEKPLTTSVDDARAVMALRKQHGTPLHLGYFQPFRADMQGVRAVVESGRLGNITHIRYRNAHHAAYGRWFDSPDLRWFTDPELAGGGAFMDMGTHAIHLVRTLLGPVESVSASIGNASGIYPAVDDHGATLLRFASGALGYVEASWIQTGGPSGLEITGSEGALYRDPQKGYVVAAPGKDPTAVPAGEARPMRVDRLIAMASGNLSEAELDADLAASVDAVAIMEACYRSSRAGCWQDVDSI